MSEKKERKTSEEITSIEQLSNEQSKRGHLDRISNASEKNDSEMSPFEENFVHKVRVYDAWLQLDRANHGDQNAQNEVDQEGAKHVGQP